MARIIRQLSVHICYSGGKVSISTTPKSSPEGRLRVERLTEGCLKLIHAYCRGEDCSSPGLDEGQKILHAEEERRFRDATKLPH